MSPPSPPEFSNLTVNGSFCIDRLNSMAAELQQEESSSTSFKERLIFPQHLQQMIQAATKITIIPDNAKVPPLSVRNTAFREKLGLSSLPQDEGSTSPLGGDKSRKNSKSRWESMPQPKRIVDDDIPSLPSLARIRQCGFLHGHDIGYGIPMQWDGPLLSEDTATPSTDATRGDTVMDKNRQHDKSSGLNIPRRRESFDVSGIDLVNKEGVSLLSQVLNAFDLSDDEDEENPTTWTPPGTTRLLYPLSPLGRFTAPLSNETRPALSPEQPKRKSADSLSIPVRRDSIDSVDILKDELAGIFSDDEDDSDHVDSVDEDNDGGTELYDDSEEGEGSSSSFREVGKEHTVLANTSTPTKSTTFQSAPSSKDVHPH